VPPKTLHEAVEEKRNESAGNMAVDYGLHAALTGDISFDTLDEIGDVIRAGLPTIKTFMTYADRFMSDDGHRWGVMNKVAEHGGMSLVHAEDDALLTWLTKKYVREGKTHGAYVSETRGPIVEEAAIRRAMCLAERSGSPLYVLHMAASAGIDALSEGRAKGLPFYGETLLAYLSFSQEDLWDERPFEAGGREYPQRGLLYNNNPPPKFPADKAACLDAIADDRLQVVSTDHAYVAVSDRYEKVGTTVEAMQAGQAAIELRLPVLFQMGVQEDRISANRFVELISTNPAKLFGLWPRKGDLAVGSDADIVVFDPNKKWTVRWQDLHMSAEYSCWEGWELTGKPRTTILRGAVLVEDEIFVGSKTGGQFVPRTLLPDVLSHPPNFGRTSESARLVAQVLSGLTRLDCEGE
jgi:dihydropyrimidinase